MPAPLLSVLVPTYGRPTGLLNLLNALAEQDLQPHEFEVIVCDDGSPEPVAEALPNREWPFPLTLLRQDNAGPGAARNRALAAAQAETVVIFNDDAVPFPNVLSRHLAAQRAFAGGPPKLVLGTFDFRPEACAASALQDAIQHGDMIFLYSRAAPDRDLHWAFCWTCNLSMPTAALRAMGGFDERFPHPMMEDVELGLRMFRDLGARIRFDPEIRAWHDHRMTVDGLRRRARQLGWNRVTAWRLHPGEEAFRPIVAEAVPDLEDGDARDRLRDFLDEKQGEVVLADAKLRAAEQLPAPETEADRVRSRREIHSAFRTVEGAESMRAAVLALDGASWRAVDHRDPVSEGPVEVRSWGATAGRSGEQPALLLLAPDVRLPTTAVDRLRYQLAAWPDHGLVVPLSIDDLGPRARAILDAAPGKLDALNASVTRSTRGRGKRLDGAPGSVAMIRRAALESVDWTFDADDPVGSLARLAGALRAAGWRTRTALDVVAFTPRAR